jgi:tetratricopeptide (TPR) repeat protein
MPPAARLNGRVDSAYEPLAARRAFDILPGALVLGSRLDLTWVLPVMAIGTGLQRHDHWRNAVGADRCGRKIRLFEPAGSFVRAAPKEKNMKRTISLWLGLPATAGLLAFAFLPALAQTPTDASAATGKIHGTVTGEHNHSIASSGTVELSATGSKKGDYKFKISKTGTYDGELPAGTYSARVIMQDQNGFAEYSRTDVMVVVTAGQDTQQDIDLGNLGASTSVVSASSSSASAPSAPAPSAPIQAPTGAPIKGASGSIHGRVIGPDGLPTPAGTVSLSIDGGPTAKYSFPVSSDGKYSGVAAPGKYTLVFRAPNTPASKVVDEIDDIKIVAGEDLAQDDDMSRKAYLDKLTPEEKKQIEEIKKTNEAAMKDNAVIKNINADIKAVIQDFSDAVVAKDAATKVAKYSDAETLMLRDTAARPDAATLWAQLGEAQAGLGAAQNDQKKYDEAIISLKKALDMEAAANKPSGAIQGSAYAALGEIYARTGKVADANAAFDSAAKADSTRAAIFLKNESVIFSQVGNADAQAAAADEAIKIDPKQPILYYLKAQGLVVKASVDPKTNSYVAPPGCLEAYQKYLELAPDGAFAAEVKSILDSFGQKVVTTYKAPKK